MHAIGVVVGVAGSVFVVPHAQGFSAAAYLSPEIFL